jgi:hypothetical protein
MDRTTGSVSGSRAAAGAGRLLCALIALAPFLAPQAAAVEFAYDFEGCPPAIWGSPGAIHDFDLWVTLTARDNVLSHGIHGWSFGARAEGLDILWITTEGTAVDQYFNGGFVLAELVDPELNGQGEGAVCAVVLSFHSPLAALPPEGTERVARLGLQATIPPEGDLDASISFVDGLQGSGRPVTNAADAGAEYLPADLGRCDIDLRVGLPPFLRGDCDGDGVIAGRVTDAVFLLRFNFRGGVEPPCLAACDGNGDGHVLSQVTDAVYILRFNFLSVRHRDPLQTEHVTLPLAPQRWQGTTR